MKQILLHNNRVTLVETDDTADARKDLKRIERMSATLDELITPARADVAAMHITRAAIQNDNGHKDQTRINGRAHSPRSGDKTEQE